MALAPELKEEIQTAYRDFLAGKGIKARYGQRLMIAQIARYLGSITDAEEDTPKANGTCVVEAGTGTGKTLAYLLAAIPVARALDKTLVIATATVALQDQIVSKDLPDLLAHTDLGFNWSLAKGRGRYLCMVRLEQQLHAQGHDGSDTLPLVFEDVSAEEASAARPLYEDMLSKYASGKWDGDRDHWPTPLPDDLWRQVTTDHRQCTNRHCPYFDSCAFFEARDKLEDADVVVANHDLVLADLALGGGAILPEPEQTLYVFDEAHHLPDKALNHFAASVPLHGSQQWLKQLSQALVKIQPHIGADTTSSRTLTRISEAAREVSGCLDRVEDYFEQAQPWDEGVDRGNAQHRYPQGELPELLAELAGECRTVTAGLVRQLGVLVEELQKGFDDRRGGELDRETAETWFPLMGGFHGRAEEQLRLWVAWTEDLSGDTPESAGPDTKQPAGSEAGTGSAELPGPESTSGAKTTNPPAARWATYQRWEHAEEITLYSSPVLANRLLRNRLWNRACAAVLTSATLTALGRFDRLKIRAGLPDSSEFLVVPSAFRYAEMATLEVPPMSVLPTDAEAYTDALIEKLPELWATGEAVLVLFSSRRQMQEVQEKLSPQYPELITSQDDYARQEVLRHHRERIDAGKPSVLFGVASFAEGIDLPGRYLDHVVITRLPFSVPENPIDATLAEWVTVRGGNPFMEITVPDASVRLVQAVGRLLRSESDRGRITILDRRIVTRRYGQLLLDALPPFRQIIQ